MVIKLIVFFFHLFLDYSRSYRCSHSQSAGGDILQGEEAGPSSIIIITIHTTHQTDTVHQYHHHHHSDNSHAQFACQMTLKLHLHYWHGWHAACHTPASVMHHVTPPQVTCSMSHHRKWHAACHTTASVMQHVTPPQVICSMTQAVLVTCWKVTKCTGFVVWGLCENLVGSKGFRKSVILVVQALVGLCHLSRLWDEPLFSTMCSFLNKAQLLDFAGSLATFLFSTLCSFLGKAQLMQFAENLVFSILCSCVQFVKFAVRFESLRTSCFQVCAPF